MKFNSATAAQLEGIVRVPLWNILIQFFHVSQRLFNGNGNSDICVSVRSVIITTVIF